MTKMFFATVQNKLHYAVHENTAAEVIYNRVDNEKPFVGMTNFKGNYVTRDDVKIAKNYLSEVELQRLNLLVSVFLDFAEFQALEILHIVCLFSAPQILSLQKKRSNDRMRKQTNIFYVFR